MVDYIDLQGEPVNRDFFIKKLGKNALEQVGEIPYQLGNVISWVFDGNRLYAGIVAHHKMNYPGTLAGKIAELAANLYYPGELAKLSKKHNDLTRFHNPDGNNNRDEIKQLIYKLLPISNRNNDICIHMRLGDCSIAKRRRDHTGNITYCSNPIHTSEFKETILTLNKRFPQNTICFCTGIHNYDTLIKDTYKLQNTPGQGTYESTINTLVDIGDFVKSNNIPFRFRLNSHPDEDFMYMLCCKLLVTTYGSFGRVIRDLRAHYKIGDQDIKLGPRNAES